LQKEQTGALKKSYNDDMILSDSHKCKLNSLWLLTKGWLALLKGCTVSQASHFSSLQPALIKIFFATSGYKYAD
jgi:hypothetical protein